VFVCMFTYRYTEFVCVGVYLPICTQNLHGYVYTQNDTQCVHTCAGYRLKYKCEQV